METSEPTAIRCASLRLASIFADLPARELGPKKLKEVREDMIALGWTRTTVNKSVNRIKLCFTWAASEELCPPEIAMGLKTVSGLKRDRSAAREKEPIGPVDDDVVTATLPHLDDMMADAVKVMRLTFSRPSEVLGMTTDKFDRSDPECWVYRVEGHKTGITVSPERYSSCTSPSASPAPYAQVTIEPHLLRHPVRTASSDQAPCKKAGVSEWSPNQLRHRGATDVPNSMVLRPRKCCSVTVGPTSRKSTLNATWPKCGKSPKKSDDGGCLRTDHAL